MREKILVTGATGKVSSDVVRRLRARGCDVKAGTRQPEEGRRRFGGDVEVVELDYEQTDTWDGAVEWADRVFLVPPPFDPAADEILEPFVEWAVASKVRHVVVLSAMAISDREDLALRRVERALVDSEVSHTILRPNLFMQNFGAEGERQGMWRELHRTRGAVEVPAGEARVSFVDARDVARVAADALTGEAHRERIHTLTGPEALSFREALDRISAAGGGPINYRPVEEEAFAGMLRELHWPRDGIEAVLSLFESVRGGHREEVVPDLQELLGEPPRTFDSYAEEVAESWRVE